MIIFFFLLDGAACRYFVRLGNVWLDVRQSVIPRPHDLNSLPSQTHPAEVMKMISFRDGILNTLPNTRCIPMQTYGDNTYHQLTLHYRLPGISDWAGFVFLF